MSSPMAVCTACGAFAYSPSQINQQCFKRYDGKRCRGIMEAAVHYSFQDCPACGGTGREGNNKICIRCAGRRQIATPYRPGK